MRERALTIAAVLITLVALAFAIQRHVERISPGAKARRLLGGDDHAETIRGADKVVAFRLGDPPGYPEHSDRIERYPVIAGPLDVPQPTAKALSDLLLSDRSYTEGLHKECAPRYGVRLAFQRGRDETEVNLCFECQLALIRRQRQIVSTADFDPAASQLAQLIRPLFPNDAQIQALP